MALTVRTDIGDDEYSFEVVSPPRHPFRYHVFEESEIVQCLDWGSELVRHRRAKGETGAKQEARTPFDMYTEAQFLTLCAVMRRVVYKRRTYKAAATQ